MLRNSNKILSSDKATERRQGRSPGEALQHHRPIFGRKTIMMIQWIIKGDDRVQRIVKPIALKRLANKLGDSVLAAALSGPK